MPTRWVSVSLLVASIFNEAGVVIRNLRELFAALEKLNFDARARSMDQTWCMSLDSGLTKWRALLDSLRLVPMGQAVALS
ncbi:hypothetical protein OAD85_08080 [Actinomycetota bacterium]|nr:hypothetical protein [Actinomycetota bacterium]